MWMKVRAILVISVFSFLACNCGNHYVKVTDAPGQLKGNYYSTNGDYKLQPGDNVEIKFFYNPELNEQTTVRPDGKIALQLVDDIFVAGFSPEEVDKILTTKYSTILEEPDLTIFVRKFAGQKVYVGGEVRNPGVVIMDGQLTLVEAIIERGGFNIGAKKDNVLIIRKNGNAEPDYYVTDITKAIGNVSPENNILLQPFDVVYVPQSKITKINLFVDQYVDELTPISVIRGFEFIIFRK